MPAGVLICDTLSEPRLLRALQTIQAVPQERDHSYVKIQEERGGQPPPEGGGENLLANGLFRARSRQ